MGPATPSFHCYVCSRIVGSLCTHAISPQAPSTLSRYVLARKALARTRSHALPPFRACTSYRAQSSRLYEPERCSAFVCDIANNSLDPPVAPGTIDVAVMIFVLSAVQPTAMASVVRKLYEVSLDAATRGEA